MVMVQMNVMTTEETLEAWSAGSVTVPPETFGSV